MEFSADLPIWSRLDPAARCYTVNDFVNAFEEAE